MNFFFIFLGIFIIFFIPIPIKFSIYYSTIDYYVKLYGFKVLSQKEIHRKVESKIKKEDNFFLKLSKYIDWKSLISTIHNLKFKPSLKMKLYLDYSLNDAARTAIFYGVLSQLPPLIYILIKVPFNVSKFDFKIKPIFEDMFLLKIETSSIIFISFANIIYMIIILLKFIKTNGRWSP